MKTKILNFRNPLNTQHRLVYIAKHKNERTTYKTILSTKDVFLKSQLFNEIVNATLFLNECSTETIPVWFRIKCIFKDVHHVQYCPICGKICKLNISTKDNEPIFKTTCCNPTCIAKHSASSIKPQSDELKVIHSHFMSERRNKLRKQYNYIINSFFKNKTNIINNIKDIKAFCENAKMTQNKNSTLIKEHQYFINIDILLDILKITSFIPLKHTKNNNISVSDFNWHERIYCILNDIKQRPHCCFCKTHETTFIKHKWKYNESCPKCSREKQRITMGLASSQQIKQLIIESNKYEILSFPEHDLLNNPLKIKCKKCGYISNFFIINGKMQLLKNMVLCHNCEKYTSNAEAEIRKLILQISNNSKNIVFNSRDIISPMEIDIYDSDRKLAIEFNGLYWHNDNVVKSNYHLLKTTLCEKQGIQLIHIFENEWIFKRDIVESRIKNLFGVYDNIVYARKCIIREIDSNTAKIFQNNNHIQGAINAKIKIGLFYNNELISLMTFGKCRFDKKHEWELLRFCNKLGYHIPGAASKLLKYFERTYNPKSLVSYADRRWSRGKLYEALGFECIRKSSPNYWYYKPSASNNLLSRVSCQKHKLKTMLEYFDPNLSEYKNMKNNGYCRIFDSGNLVFEKIY